MPGRVRTTCLLSDTASNVRAIFSSSAIWQHTSSDLPPFESRFHLRENRSLLLVPQFLTASRIHFAENGSRAWRRGSVVTLSPSRLASRGAHGCGGGNPVRCPACHQAKPRLAFRTENQRQRRIRRPGRRCE